MKSIIWLSCFVLTGIFLAPRSSFSVMHISNSSLRFECVYCHPEGVGGGLPKAPCIDCHKNSNGGNYTDLDTIEVANHSSAATSEKYGVWERECVDCHDPHGPNGINISDGITDDSYVLVDLTVNQAVTDTVNDTTTFTSMEIGTIHDPAWTDPTTWGQKTGPERGLLFVWHNPILNKYYWYEVISATATSITIGNAATNFKQAPKDNPISAQLVYGMLIQDESGPYPIKFGGPNTMANDESGTGLDPTPTGICQVCHTQTLHWRNDGSLANHYSGQNCITCHDHRNGFAHGGGPGTSCETCHGESQAFHQATPGSGWVVVHADTDHDDAGWNGPKPYFDVAVDCVTCHATDLPSIHGNDCSTCHPSPYDTLGTWSGGCQQGGCHTVYHEDSTMAHWPWENAWNSGNVDCDLCHNPGINAVVQENCLNCHATYGPGDSTPPTTSLKDQINEPIGPAPVEFVGSTQVRFSMQDNNGKVGIGRTYYNIDGGPTTGAMEMIVSNDNPGTHDINYWSIDQSGNEESPKSQTYTMVQDSTAPTTSSNALAEYWPTTSRVITFTATDGNSTMGMKNTYFRYNGGAVQTGSKFTVPLPTGTYTNNTLEFWSVDWSGNTEEINTVTFTTHGGTVTLKLVWWDCDINPNHCPESGEWANWYVWRGGWGYSVSSTVAHGGGDASAGWDGVDEIALPVSPIPYFIRVEYEYFWEEGELDYDQTDFPNRYFTTPGQVIKLNY